MQLLLNHPWLKEAIPYLKINHNSLISKNLIYMLDEKEKVLKEINQTL